MTGLTSRLACPRCSTALDGWRCVPCRVEFPVLGGVPWLFADPEAAITDWQNRWQYALSRIDADRTRVRQALKARQAEPTRLRLEVLDRGYQAQRAELSEIMAPLKLSQGGSLESHLALRTRLPATQGLLSYEANVHRDWCWGEAENDASLKEVLAVLEDAAPQRVLVLGAGAGRLAYDLHRHLQPELTVAVDLNPLLAYVGHRVSQGETLTLTEFPLAPPTPCQAALKRTLRAPEPAAAGLHFVLADVLRLPFRPESFDLVVTPWLLDVVEGSVDLLLSRINGALAMDGLWVNHGSAAFQNPDPALRFTLEELEALAGERGLVLRAGREARLPYMNSPDSGHGRTERIVTRSASKTRHLKRIENHRALPDWIVTGRCPVPALPAFQTQAMTTRIHAFIMSLIDGRRSLKDMAAELEAQRLMTRKEAEVALRGFLTKMHEEASRSTGL